MPKAALKNRPANAPKNSLWKNFRQNYFFYLLPIPGIVFLIMFAYMPMAGAYMAFTRYNFKGGIFGSPFIGLDNFKFFFQSWKYAWRATRNTLVINILSMFIGISFNVIVASILGEVKSERYRKFIQAIILFPHFMSWIIMGALSEPLLQYDGILNQLITALGGEAINWYAEPQYWWTIFIVSIVWKGFGYGCIIYYATLTGFDPALYEAAAIDGAGRIRKFTKITLPLLMPTISIMFLLGIGGIMGGSLEMIMGMTKMQSLLYETTDTVTTYVYRMTMDNGNFGQSAAISLYQSLFGFVTVLLSNFLVKKADPDYALF